MCIAVEHGTQGQWSLTFSRQVFDKQGTGYITPSDLRAVLMCVGENLTENESRFCHFFFSRDCNPD